MFLYDKDGNKINLYDMAEFFIRTYPKDIFVNNPKPIIKIREGFEEIIRIRDDKNKVKGEKY